MSESNSNKSKILIAGLDKCHVLPYQLKLLEQIASQIPNVYPFNDIEYEPVSEEEMFREMVADAAEMEDPKERKLRMQRQNREFINTKTKGYRRRKY